MLRKFNYDNCSDCGKGCWTTSEEAFFCPACTRKMLKGSSGKGGEGGGGRSSNKSKSKGTSKKAAPQPKKIKKKVRKAIESDDEDE